MNKAFAREGAISATSSLSLSMSSSAGSKNWLKPKVLTWFELLFTSVGVPFLDTANGVDDKGPLQFWFEGNKLGIFITPDMQYARLLGTISVLTWRKQFQIQSFTRAISCSSSVGDFIFGMNMELQVLSLCLDPLLQPNPIVEVSPVQQHSWLIVASDGFWDVFPSGDGYSELVKVINRIVKSLELSDTKYVRIDLLNR